MNTNPEGRPNNPQLERQINYADFILNILDERYRIEESLLRKDSSITITANDFHCENYEPPEILDRYLEPFSSVTVDMSATRNEHGVDVIDHITIRPEDSRPISMCQSGDVISIQQGESRGFLPLGSLESMLRQLLPYQVRNMATTSQILEFVSASSLETSYSISYSTEQDGHRNQISFSKTETRDDSIDTLEVIKYAPHTSGRQIGTRMHLSESISRRQTESQDHVQHELIIEATNAYDESKELTVETILNTDGRSVIVNTATRRHISDITDVLAILN